MSLSKQKHHEKILLMRILFYPLRNVLLEIQSKIPLFAHKKISCEKVYCSFGLTLKEFYQFFKKLSVTNNSIVILGYSNGKNIYIAKNIILIDYLILFARFSTFNQQGSTYSITLCLQKSLRKLNILN